MSTHNHRAVRPADRMASIPPYFFHTLNQRLAELRARGLDVIRMDAGSPDLPGGGVLMS